jgi:FkbH-like protein
MAGNFVRCLIISDFNSSNLAGYLRECLGVEDFSLAVECGPYGQVQQLLMDPAASCWQRPSDALVVWTTPQAASGTFRRALEYEPFEIEAALHEVDEFARLVCNAAKWTGSILVPTWTMPFYHRGFGMLDWKKGVGLADLLNRMNVRLSDQLAANPQIFLLDAARWAGGAGKFASNPKLWYLGKIPFGHEVFQAAAADLRAAINGVRGQARKLIVVDLDDTLWGGIVGDAGWNHLQLGGHDPVGEAYVDFQRELKALTRRGVVLGIVSKNDEAVALEAIRSHPEMVLRENDFAGWRIDWNDKARNLAELAADLNLGLQSVVFIDDNPAERARVRETFPEVLVPDWPEDRMLYCKTLLELRCFDAPSIGDEDQKRTAMYVADGKRKSLQRTVGSLQEWLHSLDMRVSVAPMKKDNLQRTIQLLNKTNQMNLSTRRLTESELAAWAAQEGNAVWTIRVSDRFGDAGLTGIVSVSRQGDVLHIVDFILSCRVFGRQIEQLMLHLVVSEACRRGCREVRAKYLPTAKNKPTLEFLESSGFDREEGGDHYRWPQERECRVPAHLKVEEDVV